ncbi:MAG: VWA domain-containing protein [Cytophagales bacterium]|nr:VWA domain-containing protein [Cytophagales bacterium]
MDRISLLFESPPWLIGVGVLIGLAYAAILYYRTKVLWSQNVNYILAALRFLMVMQLTLLLFGPLIRQIKNTKEPPAIIFAIDNSKSISEIEDSARLETLHDEIISLKKGFDDKGYFTEIRTYDAQQTVAGQIAFDEKSSNLNALLKGVQNDYESRNLSNVLLFSDGLYNLGNNPAFYPYNFSVSTVGLGDTTQRPDLNLNAVLYNKIAYQGNKFPVVAELFSYNLAGKTAIVQLRKKGDIIDQKQVKISNQNQFDQIEFLVEASESGMNRYRLSVLPVDGEFITSNNTKEAYVDIIDGKQKILLLAPSPHPDIKAIKNALESNENYELVIHIEGINNYIDDQYDAVILHQVPDKRRKYLQILNKISREKIPAFFIYGNQSDINRFNDLNGAVRIQPISYQRDNAFPFYNPEFSKFLYQDENIEALNEFSPVKVPFANFDVLPQSEVMFFQKVGKINTQKPLLLIHRADDWNSAVFLGEGFWSWRLQEYSKFQTHRAFDEMISKIIQFLSTKADKRKFKVYPVKDEFLNSEIVVFETEVYNDIYEQTYGHKIDLKITDEQNNTKGYSYVTSEKNSKYRIRGLENGIYSYDASAVIEGENEISSGTFTVNDLQIETTKLTADHNLLRNIAALNQGKFYGKNQLDQLREDVLNQEMINEVYSSEKYLAIINMKWGFFILILFISAEWFLRKFHGSY